MDKTTVRQAIVDAFAGVTLGDGIGLWQAQAIDDYAPESLRLEARAVDEKDDWQALISSDLQRCASSLAFFDAAGMRFHLPAFMVAEIDGLIDDCCLFHLIQLDAFAKAKLGTLNTAQRLAVRAYLQWHLQDAAFTREYPTIMRAIETFWS